jgi:hypothetical protein
MSMRTGMWLELIAEHEARYTDEGISLVITMSKTSGLAEGLYGWVVGVSGPKIRHTLPSALHTQKFSSSRGQPRVPVYMLGVQVASH